MTDRYLIEKCLVEHCSATLASMKSANLFNMTFADDTDVEDQIEFWNQCMKEKRNPSLYITETGKTCTGLCLSEETARGQSEPAGSSKVPEEIRL